jgi:hypothetical protein
MDAAHDGPRGLTTAMRVVLVAFLALAGLGFILLYLRSGHTDRDFAWTIKPDITAAFLGAGYGAGCVLVAASLRRPWAQVRVGIGIVLVFTAMILVMTLLHLERFHFGAANGGIARLAAWVFLAVYVFTPTVGTWLFVREQRLAGPQPPGGLALPGWFKVAVAAQGGLMVIFGAALYVAPRGVGPRLAVGADLAERSGRRELAGAHRLGQPRGAARGRPAPGAGARAHLGGVRTAPARRHRALRRPGPVARGGSVDLGRAADHRDRHRRLRSPGHRRRDRPGAARDHPLMVECNSSPA